MKDKYDIAIIGGGLAGLTAALHLSKSNYSVIVFEKNSYPHHKVCGEYVSNEVLPYLNSLGIDTGKENAKEINRLLITTKKSKEAYSHLPLGGFGMSRYTLDLLLATKVKESFPVIEATITNIEFKGTHFNLETQAKKQIEAKYVIGAFGKRSNLDKTLKRKFITKKASWLAVKTHYKADFPDDLVALHHFPGGYCGLSKVENNLVNMCYLTTYKAFKKHKSISEFEEKVISKNCHLKNFLSTGTPVFDKPLTISQISFERKNPVENHIFMIGDSAGLIHPLCGNGMAMAIQSAKILAETLIENETKARLFIEKSYALKWEETFLNRLKAGVFLQKIVMNPAMLQFGLGLGKICKGLLPYLIQKTHGKPF